MRKLAKGKWVHPICAIMTDDIEIEDFSLMKLTLTHGLTPQGTVPQCEYCESTAGQRLQCSFPSCAKSAHPFCAFQSKMTFVKGNPDYEGGWLIQLRAGNSSSEIFFPEAKKYFEQTILPDLTTSPSKPIETYSPVHNSGLELSKIEQGLRLTRSAKRQVQNVICPNLKGKGEGEYYDAKVKNSILALRGGQIAVYCEAHKPKKDYCFCSYKPKAKKEEEKHNPWICCDNCGNAFLKVLRMLVSYELCWGNSDPI